MCRAADGTMCCANGNVQDRMTVERQNTAGRAPVEMSAVDVRALREELQLLRNTVKARNEQVEQLKVRNVALERSVARISKEKQAVEVESEELIYSREQLLRDMIGQKINRDADNAKLRAKLRAAEEQLASMEQSCNKASGEEKLAGEEARSRIELLDLCASDSKTQDGNAHKSVISNIDSSEEDSDTETMAALPSPTGSPVE
mmetsp:Transcript_11725/g.35728  ORF Transcript_11725/g.35728 Transcript_11725/m.35728 type:complete len:203 (-) Transcript_11725:299-907(-)